ncbi:MAG: single-stranded DNA-binding protein [Endomicrobiia bacterium]
MKNFSDENRVILSGRLTENPVLRYTQKSVPVCRFNLAINSYTKGIKEALFIPIVSWSELALECSSTLQKGSSVKIEGKLVGRQWEDSEGKSHKTIEVVANKIELVIINKTPKPEETNLKEDIPEEE